jgi:hypothetical protein
MASRMGPSLVTSKRKAAGVLDAEIAAGDAAAERQALEVEKPPAPLQIVQRIHVGSARRPNSARHA